MAGNDGSRVRQGAGASKGAKSGAERRSVNDRGSSRLRSRLFRSRPKSKWTGVFSFDGVSNLKGKAVF